MNSFLGKWRQFQRQVEKFKLERSWYFYMFSIMTDKNNDTFTNISIYLYKYCKMEKFI